VPHKNPAVRKAYHKRYYKQYYKKNKKHILLLHKQWRKNGKGAEASRRNRKKYPQKARDASREWSKRNPEKRRASKHTYRANKRGNGGSYTPTQWAALYNKHRNRCLCCGKKKRLSPDHVAPISKGGTSNIGNIQPLCLPCNLRKGNKSIDYRRKHEATQG